MKIAPFVYELGKQPDKFEHFLVHTGQHYDAAMSKSFFQELDIPEPDIDLGIGSGTHAEQVGKTMIEFEKVVRDWRPDWIVVVGDVNATCACSIVAKKEHVKLAHIEAGLRSFDSTMPEEINRLVTDRLSDLLLTPDELSSQNLRDEGVSEERIRFVGNIMIDTLEKHRVQAEELVIADIIDQNAIPGCQGDFHRKVGKEREAGFAVLTLHRPSNVDSRETLAPIVEFFIDQVATEMPLVWTLHPRTKKQLERFGLWSTIQECPGIITLAPLGYHQMLKLNMSAAIMFTDSGGLQEESCVLGTPCVTLRDNTERPITLSENGGLSVLTGNTPSTIQAAYEQAKTTPPHPVCPPLWDGHTAARIVEVFLESIFGAKTSV